jgi:hypothetical protein
LAIFSALWLHGLLNHSAFCWFLADLVGASVPVFVQGVVSAALGSCFPSLNVIVEIDRASEI